MTLNHHIASSPLLSFTFRLALSNGSSLPCMSQPAEFSTVFGVFEQQQRNSVKKY